LLSVRGVLLRLCDLTDSSYSCMTCIMLLLSVRGVLLRLCDLTDSSYSCMTCIMHGVAQHNPHSPVHTHQCTHLFWTALGPTSRAVVEPKFIAPPRTTVAVDGFYHARDSSCGPLQKICQNLQWRLMDSTMHAIVAVGHCKRFARIYNGG
jgi:hypothetical protein